MSETLDLRLSDPVRLRRYVDIVARSGGSESGGRRLRNEHAIWVSL